MAPLCASLSVLENRSMGNLTRLRICQNFDLATHGGIRSAGGACASRMSLHCPEEMKISQVVG
jgi:hypothetical protein